MTRKQGHDPELGRGTAPRVAMQQRFFDRDHPRVADVQRDPLLPGGVAPLELICEDTIVIRFEHDPVIGRDVGGVTVGPVNRGTSER
jgi:hypothetical protein